MPTPESALATGPDGRRRCWWGAGSPEYAAYHDEEWGRPVVGDDELFERLCLEGFQSGLSWITILRDRKSTRLNSSHVSISYAVFCLKKKIDDLMHDESVHLGRDNRSR